MISKALQNSNFRATTRYVLQKEEARLLDRSLIADKFDTISREFLMSRDLKPEIERPVYHLILSYSYQDAETQHLTDDFLRDRAVEHFAGLVVSAREPELLRQSDKSEYKRKVESFLESELYDYQWFCATHEDTKHQHTHLVVSRINLIDTKCIPTWQDAERCQRICREMEREHGLESVQSFYEIERRSITRRQKEKWEKTGIAPVMVQLQDAIDQEIRPGRSIKQVIAGLNEQYGIEAKPKLNKGKQSIVFEKMSEGGEVVRMSGSQLGRGYTYAAIEQRLEHQAQAQALLEFADRRLTETGRNRLKTRDDRYTITLDSQSGDVAIAHQSEKEGTGKIIAQGKLMEQGWNIAIAQVEPEDQQHFERYQQQRQADLVDRYAHYAQPRSEAQLQPEQRDLLVVWRALQAGESVQETAAILAAGSEQARIIRQQQGQDAALEYLEQVKREVLDERDRNSATRSRAAASDRLAAENQKKQQDQER